MGNEINQRIPFNLPRPSQPTSGVANAWAVNGPGNTSMAAFSGGGENSNGPKPPSWDGGGYLAGNRVADRLLLNA